MVTAPIPGLSLGISPSSSASASSGMKMIGEHGGGYTGTINVGAGSQSTWVSGLVRDFAIGVGVALAAKYLWGRLK